MFILKLKLILFSLIDNELVTVSVIIGPDVGWFLKILQKIEMLHLFTQ